MWHTAQISYPANKETLAAYFKRKDEIYPKDGKWMNSSLAPQGIDLWTYPVKKQGFSGTLIYAKVNFMKLLQTKNRVLVASERHNADCFAVFKKLMQEHFPELPSDINEWTTNRVDYCINTHTKYFNEYPILFNKTASRLRTHKKCSKPQSYYFGNDSYTLNIYNKPSNVLYDLRDRNDIPPTEKGHYITDSWGVLRIEVQCFPRKLTQIKGKQGLESKTLGELLSDAIAMEILEWALLNTVGTAPYLRRSVAIERVTHMDCSKGKKQRMIQMINDIGTSKKMTMDTVRDRYIKEGIMTKQTFDRYCKELQAANINPVTIPDRWKLSGKGPCDGLPSVYGLYLDALQKEFGNSDQ